MPRSTTNGAALLILLATSSALLAGSTHAATSRAHLRQGLSNQQQPQVVEGTATIVARSLYAAVADAGDALRKGDPEALAAAADPAPADFHADLHQRWLSAEGDGAQGGASSSKRKVCLNTCSKAMNGICEDGRKKDPTSKTNEIRMVYCDLGTDCDDCGPWETSAEKVPWEAPGSVGPIALLMSKDVQVRARNAFIPEPYSFGFAYTDPAKDFDVSRHMDTGAIVEAGISSIFYKIFDGVCVDSKGMRKLFVDVGANFGWYAALAAAMGCRVIGFEPVPHFHAFFVYTTYLNDFQDRITIMQDVVNDVHFGEVNFVVPARGIWGTAGIDGMNIDKAIPSDKEELKLKSVALDEVVREDVLLMKVDVEGFEWSVIKGGTKLLKNYKVDNIIMEYSPGVPERSFDFPKMLATPTMLADIIKAGFRIGHIFEGRAGAGGSGGIDSDIPPYDEITLDNLKYDIHDIGTWKEGLLGCPPVGELKPYVLWRGCGGVPEDVSPRSMRSEIGHNTNIWASKNMTILQLKGVVGIIKPHEPKETFYSTKAEGKYGQGHRPCHHLPPDVQIRHRCKCTVESVCGAEGRAVENVAQRGLLPTNYILP